MATHRASAQSEVPIAWVPIKETSGRGSKSVLLGTRKSFPIGQTLACGSQIPKGTPSIKAGTIRIASNLVFGSGNEGAAIATAQRTIANTKATGTE